MFGVLVVFAAIGIVLVAPHAGEMFPKSNPDPNVSGPTPGIVWIYLTVLAAIVLTSVINLAYETIATARYGRTLGKAWLHIRAVREDGSPLELGRSLGRAALYLLVVPAVQAAGVLDPLWCLWDENRQCLHDKAVGTIVIND